MKSEASFAMPGRALAVLLAALMMMATLLTAISFGSEVRIETASVPSWGTLLEVKSVMFYSP